MIYLLSAFVFVVPFIFWTGSYEFSEVPKQAIITAMVPILWLIHIARGGRINIISPWLVLALSLFLSWCGLSMLWGINTYEGMLVIIPWAWGTMFVFLVASVCDSPDKRRLLVWSCFASGVMVACFGIIEHLYGSRLFPSVASPAASFGNKNMAAQFMVLVLPVGAWLFVKAESCWEEIVTLLGCVMIGTFLVYTGAKAAWVAAVVGGAAIFVWTGISLMISRLSEEK